MLFLHREPGPSCSSKRQPCPSHVRRVGSFHTLLPTARLQGDEQVYFFVPLNSSPPPLVQPNAVIFYGISGVTPARLLIDERRGGEIKEVDK